MADTKNYVTTWNNGTEDLYLRATTLFDAENNKKIDNVPTLGKFSENNDGVCFNEELIINHDLLKSIFNKVIINGEYYHGNIDNGYLVLTQAAGLYDANDKLISSLTLEQSGENATSVKSLLTNNVKKVILPYGITSIGADAFKDCNNLISVEFLNTPTVIGHGAFENCASLKTIEIPEGVTTIEYNAFKNCLGLDELNIPNSVTTIGENAFYRIFISKIHYEGTASGNPWGAIKNPGLYDADGNLLSELEVSQVESGGTGYTIPASWIS